MNQKGFINIGVIVGIAVLIGVAGYFVVNQRSTSDSTPTPSSTSIGDVPTPGRITVIGEITCLPKQGSGPQTMECAIGLKGDDGRYYGLKNLFAHDPQYKFSRTGLRVEVSGLFSFEKTLGPAGAKYEVVGTIDVASIKEVVKQ
jgi:hypothetical protein